MNMIIIININGITSQLPNVPIRIHSHKREYYSVYAGIHPLLPRSIVIVVMRININTIHGTGNENHSQLGYPYLKIASMGVLAFIPRHQVDSALFWEYFKNH